MTHKTVTWFLIADGAQARIFANDGLGPGLHRVTNQNFSADLPSQVSDIVSDQGGRAANPAGGGHHRLEPQTDPRQHIETEFLRGVASVLDNAALEKRFDKLVLVAAPRALGTLRGMLSSHTAALVGEELNKDLVHLSEQDLEQHLINAGVLR